MDESDRPIGTRDESVHAAYERLDAERARTESEIRAVLVSASGEDLGRALRAERLVELYQRLAGVLFQLEAVVVADAQLHPIYADVVAWAVRGARSEATLWAENALGWRAEIVEGARRVGRQNAMLAGLVVDDERDGDA
jgi:hypothetical protein